MTTKDSITLSLSALVLGFCIALKLLYVDYQGSALKKPRDDFWFNAYTELSNRPALSFDTTWRDVAHETTTKWVEAEIRLARHTCVPCTRLHVVNTPDWVYGTITTTYTTGTNMVPLSSGGPVFKSTRP